MKTGCTAAAGAALHPTMSPITTPSGACPNTMAARCSKSCCSTGSRPGLSWITILRKRDNYRAALDNFDAQKMALYDADKKAELMQNAGIVRNRLKIDAAVTNAQAYLAFGSDEAFSQYLWGFVDGAPIVNRFTHLDQVPAATPLAEAISRDLKKRGFRFVGPTIVYAFMQAVGMVNDHLVDCHRHEAVHAKNA
jgi:DNA-3-methyladenine glycosylase I